MKVLKNVRTGFSHLNNKHSKEMKLVTNWKDLLIAITKV